MNYQAERLRRLAQGLTPGRQGYARVVAVTSGKGGVGKTNLAANLGTCLCAYGHRTAILDGDLGMANVNIVLGVNPSYDIGHVLSGEKRLLEIAAPGPAGLQVFAGGTGLYDVANLSAWRLESLLGALAEVEEVCDFLLVDTGAGLGQAVIRLVLSAAEILLVTTPEPTALADAYGLVKVVAQRSPGARVHLVVNMVHREGEGDQVFQNFQRAVRRFLQFDLSYLGEVPFDPMVAKAVQEQVPFVLKYPNSRAGRAVGKLAGNLLGLEVPTAGGIRGLFRRMFRSHSQGWGVDV